MAAVCAKRIYDDMRFMLLAGHDTSRQLKSDDALEALHVAGQAAMCNVATLCHLRSGPFASWRRNVVSHASEHFSRPLLSCERGPLTLRCSK